MAWHIEDVLAARKSLPGHLRALARAYAGKLVRYNARDPAIEPMPGAVPPDWAGDLAVLELFESVGATQEFVAAAGYSPLRPPLRPPLYPPHDAAPQRASAIGGRIGLERVGQLLRFAG